MKIDIRKYKYKTTGIRNYFNNVDFFDKITFTEILDEGFPIYNEEFNNEFDSLSIIASDFDLKFHLLQGVSSFLGKSIESFFKSDIADVVMICRVILDDKVIGGIIDKSSLKFNYTFTENRYDVQFTIYSIETELKAFCQGSPATPSFTLNTFSSFIGGTRGNQNGVCFFRSIDHEILPTYFKIDCSNLNWITRCGYEPVLVHEVWAELIAGGAIPQDCTCWTLFEDLLKGFGIIYQIKIELTDEGNYFKFKMYLGFRDTGFSSTTKNILLESHEEGFKIDDNINEIQIFKYGKVVGSGNTDPDESVYYGLVYDSTRKVTIDGAAIGSYSDEFISQNENGIFLNEIRSLFPAFLANNETINFVEFNHYIKSAVYSSFIPAGWNYYVFATPHEANNSDMLQYLTRKAYPFPRFWTKAGYNLTTSNFRFFDAHSIIYIDNPGSQNTHDLWYTLIESTTYKAFTYLVSTLKQTLFAKVNLFDSYNLSLFDKTIINNIEYILQRLRNLDLNKRNVDTEWLETRKIVTREDSFAS